jgi:D-tyrosyl-tRNA(Tyr) deacylase
MRLVVQRVERASVTVEGEQVASIGRGLLVYVGVGKGDCFEDGARWAKKVVELRIFEDQGKMTRALEDVGGSLLAVSQFTLYGDVSKGRRPSFERAMAPDLAEAVYEAFVARARERVPVQTGRFRRTMRVESINDGPVTLCLEDTRSK